MTGSEKQTVHFTANCTVLLAFFVALFFPIGYFAISYQYAVGSLETEASHAPVTGTPMFRMTIAMEVPAEVPLRKVREGLAGLCDQLNMDFFLEARG